MIKYGNNLLKIILLFRLITGVLFSCEKQKDHMYAERGPRVTHVNTVSIITLQNIVPAVRNESRKQSRIVFMYI